MTELIHTISPVLAALTFLVSLGATLYRPLLGAVVIAFVMPLNNFAWHGPVSVVPWQSALYGFLAGLLGSATREGGLLRRLYWNRRMSFFAVLLLLSALAGMLLLPDFANLPDAENWFRSPGGRTVTQLLSLATRVMLVQVAVMSVRRIENLQAIFRALLLSTALLVLGGAYELLAVRAGLPWMGIIRPEQGVSGHTASFNLPAGIAVPRLGSLVGEPKALAQFLLPILLLSFLMRSMRVAVRGFLASKAFLAVTLALFVLTFSTSSWLALVVSAPVVTFIGLRRYFWPVASGALLVVGAVAIAAIQGETTLGTIIALRLIEPFRPLQQGVEYLYSYGSVLRGYGSETAAVLYLLDNPRFLWLGVGPGNGTYHIAPLLSHSLEAIVSVNSGVVRELLEWGVPGLLAFWWLFFGALREASRVGGKLPHSSAPARLLWLSMALMIPVLANDLFFSSEGSGQVWFYLGILAASTRLGRAHAAAPRTRPAAYAVEQPALALTR